MAFSQLEILEEFVASSQWAAEGQFDEDFFNTSNIKYFSVKVEGRVPAVHAAKAREYRKRVKADVALDLLDRDTRRKGLKRYLTQMRAERPDEYARRLEQRREANRRYAQKVKQDPVLRAAYLARERIKSAKKNAKRSALRAAARAAKAGVQ